MAYQNIEVVHVVACDEKQCIGKENQLPWHISEDLQHFKHVTQGGIVIMGRKTWESLPEKFRPLPGRQNIVVSRDPAYKAHGADLAGSLEGALALAGGAEEVFVIGGEQLYRAALPFADRLYLTEVELEPEADAFFPELNPAVWQEVERRASGESMPACTFVVYVRR